MRKLRLKKFMKCATKIVMRLRADKRLMKIKSFLGGAKNRDDVKRLVIQDWQRADYLGSGKTNFVKFDFEFSEVNIGNNSLPIQHDNKIDTINLTYEAIIQIGFDDLSKINDLKENDAELLGYKVMDVFNIHLYPEIKTDEPYRYGAYEESGFRGKLGEHLNYTTCDDTQNIYRPLMDNFLKPQERQSHEILYPKSNLKRFFPLPEVTETDPEYMLRWEKVEYPDILKIESIPKLEDKKTEIVSSAPGYQSLRVINNSNVEKLNYFKKKYNLQPDVFKDSRIERFNPDIIHQISKDDE